MRPVHPFRAPAAGFTLVETLVSLLIFATLLGMALMIAPEAWRSAQADSGAGRIVSLLRTAREQAISQRRNIRITFNAPNQIVVSRVEQPGPNVTDINQIWLEDGYEFRVFGGVPDTPDAFGSGAPVWFNGAANVQFTSEGTFVDQNGDEVNGTVFIGQINQPTTARAVSVFGPTALVRQWNWNGGDWVE